MARLHFHNTTSAMQQSSLDVPPSPLGVESDELRFDDSPILFPVTGPSPSDQLERTPNKCDSPTNTISSIYIIYGVIDSLHHIMW